MRRLFPVALFALFAPFALPVFAEEYLNGITWQVPAVVQPGSTDSEPPSDAIVLLDGTDMTKWE